MYKKIIWPTILVLSLAMTFLFVSGFVKSIQITSGKSETTPVPIQVSTTSSEVSSKPLDQVTSGEPIELLVIGDSIGVGIGDEESLGLGNRYAQLAKDGMDQTVTVNNIAVSGAVINELMNLVKNNANDGFIQKADLIFISIGGNDMNKLLGETNLTLSSAYEDTLTKYLADLEVILNTLFEKNPKARVVMFGLYNPYGKEVGSDKINRLLDWNVQTQQLLDGYEQLAYVPTYDAFKNKLETYLSADHFHPSAKGYEIMTQWAYDVVIGR